MRLRNIIAGTLIVAGSLTLGTGIYGVVNIDYDKYPSLKKENEMSLELKRLTTDYPGSPGYFPKPKGSSYPDYNRERVIDLKVGIEELKEDIKYVGEEELRKKEVNNGVFASVGGGILISIGLYVFGGKKREEET